MEARKNKVIFFDFDGVIADSLTIAFTVAQMAKPYLTLDRFKSYFNGNINEERKKDKSVIKIDFDKEFGKHFEKLDIEDQKKLIIQKLSQSYPLFIISSTATYIIKEYLQRHGVLSCFTEILGNDVHASKVEKFAMIYEKHKIEPKNVMFITDSLGDISEARESQIENIVAILGGYQDEKTLKQGKPTKIVKNFIEFYEFILNVK